MPTGCVRETLGRSGPRGTRGGSRVHRSNRMCSNARRWGGDETVAPASVRRALGVPWGGRSSGGGSRTLWRSRQQYPTRVDAGGGGVAQRAQYEKIE